MFTCPFVSAQTQSAIQIILVPRGRAPFGQHQEITTSGPYSGQMSAHAQAARARVGMDCTISIETR